MNAGAAQCQLLTVSLPTIGLAQSMDFSQSPGEISSSGFNLVFPTALTARFQATQCLSFSISFMGGR